MADICLKIPEHVLQGIRFPPGDLEYELKKELALALYQRGAVSSGNACQIAGMDRWQFNTLLKTRKISRHYTDRDLEEDIEYARCDQ
jgi:predicted HTH domain antitoxin